VAQRVAAALPLRRHSNSFAAGTFAGYARMTRQVEALIAGAYLSGTNTRRVKRALAALFGGAVGKDVVSRTWRKVKADWDAWNKRDLAGEDIVRLILAKPEVCAGTARSCGSG